MWRNTYEREFPKARYYAHVAGLFLDTIDLETGSFLHYPYPGHLMVQPAGTMAAWRIMREAWHEKLAADQKQAAARIQTQRK